MTYFLLASNAPYRCLTGSLQAFKVTFKHSDGRFGNHQQLQGFLFYGIRYFQICHIRHLCIFHIENILFS
jgi:hypothetical protein